LSIALPSFNGFGDFSSTLDGSLSDLVRAGAISMSATGCNSVVVVSGECRRTMLARRSSRCEGQNCRKRNQLICVNMCKVNPSPSINW
jgi:hypothetical protein